MTASFCGGGTQDFLQVLALFANFGFAWPPQVLTVYHSLSVFSFNLELLAPECSVSVNYEEKFYTIQALPFLLFLGIIIVIIATRTLQVVQVRLFHTLPFGALSAMSLVDVCIGIFISGIFMLYFGTWELCNEWEGGGATTLVRVPAPARGANKSAAPVGSKGTALAWP